MSAVGALFIVLFFSAGMFCAEQAIKKHNQMVNQALNSAQGIHKVEHKVFIGEQDE